MIGVSPSLVATVQSTYGRCFTRRSRRPEAGGGFGVSLAVARMPRIIRLLPLPLFPLVRPNHPHRVQSRTDPADTH